MIDNTVESIESQMTPRPWKDAVLRAIVTDMGVKTYLYTISPTESDQPEWFVAHKDADLAIATSETPPFFEEEVDETLLAVDCVKSACDAFEAYGATVESFI
jgi:hypothetical protein